MMTDQDRIQGLRELGYSDRETSFLRIAALHSGYFVRRQFVKFIGTQDGWPDDLLVKKLEALQHARALGTFNRTVIYHLCTRPFYAAIGEENNRNRRSRPLFAVKARLMALDFVIDHPDRQYLATETEKVDYFSKERGIDKDSLPCKMYRSDRSLLITTRYFVDKFPIFLSIPDDHNSPPVVSFCYVDEGAISKPAFETYLRQYARLFRKLDRARVIYVTTHERHFLVARRSLGQFLAWHNSEKNDPRRPSHRELEDYFRLETLHRSRQFGKFDALSLERYRRLRKRYKGTEIERLYRRWKEEGSTVFSQIPALKAPDFKLFPCFLNHNYGLFGMGGCSRSRSYSTPTA